MIMATFLHEMTVDLRKRAPVVYIGEAMFTGDALADTIKINVLDDGDPATLSGTVACKIIRGDGATVTTTGTLSGNAVTVALPASAYTVSGTIRVTVTVTDNDVITSLCGIVATVTNSTTESIVDDEEIIPSIDALIAEIEEVRNSIPEDYSALASQVSSQGGAINTLNASVSENTGAISNLQTSVSKIGNLNQLVTPTKTSLVAAINEAYTYDPTAAYDTAISGTSENAVQNKVIKAALDSKMNTPASGGTAGQCLMSDGAGSLIWGTPTEVSVVLGALATKDRVQASYTPGGTISIPTLTTQVEVSNTYYPTSAASGGAVTPGTAAACTLPTLTASYDSQNKTLALSWTAGSFTANLPTSVTLPTFETGLKVTDVVVESSRPAFTGTQATITST